MKTEYQIIAVDFDGTLCTDKNAVFAPGQGMKSLAGDFKGRVAPYFSFFHPKSLFSISPASFTRAAILASMSSDFACFWYL